MAIDESINPQIRDLRRVIDNKSRQLRALLMCASFAGKSLNDLSDEVQEAYSWACTDLAEDVVNALDAIAGLELDSKGVQHV